MLEIIQWNLRAPTSRGNRDSPSQQTTANRAQTSADSFSSYNHAWKWGFDLGQSKTFGYYDRFKLTERLDANLLKDLRILGKPPQFQRNEINCKDFRFCFRIDMSFISAGFHNIERVKLHAISVFSAKVTSVVLLVRV